jgi:catechol 2,3-dioxygenase-like lactoylglutathione lyase family enzyme
MKRLHIHVAVDDLQKSIGFYATLFGSPPTKLKADYAKWMLEDPRINFAISARGAKPGVDHLGIQVDAEEELGELRERLSAADLQVFSEGETNCCYARSDKSWVQDPSGIAWEAYHTMADSELFNDAPSLPVQATAAPAVTTSACCAPKVEAMPQPSCGSGSATGTGCC